MSERTLRYAVVAVLALVVAALGTALLMDPGDEGDGLVAERDLVGDRRIPNVEGLALPIGEAAPGSTTPTSVPSSGPPIELLEAWVVRSFDDGAGTAGEVPWDPRDEETIGFEASWAEGRPGRVHFMDGCAPMWLNVLFDGATITVDGPQTFTPGSCFEDRVSDPPIKAILTGGAATIVFELVDGVLVLENTDTGASLTAVRSEDLHEPLPADIETPDELYGLWAFETWRDDEGAHDVEAPEGYALSVRFLEGPTGPVLFYDGGDCVDGAVEITQFNGDRMVLEALRRALVLETCSPDWSLQEVGFLFSVPYEVRWRVDGHTLTLENEEAGLTFTARRLTDR